MTSTNTQDAKQSLQNQLNDNFERKVLPIPDAHAIAKENPYSQKNKNGYTNFGLASNAQVTLKTLSYLPSYLQVKSGSYELGTGSEFIREFFIRKTQYKIQDVLVLNSLPAILSSLTFRSKTYFKGEKINIDQILDHSQGTKTTQQEAEISVIQIVDKEQLKYYLQRQTKRITVFVIPDKSCIETTSNKQIIYAFEHKFQQGFSAGVAFFNDTEFLASLSTVFFHAFSTLFQGTIQTLQKSKENYEIQKKFMDKVRHQEPSPQSILKMIQLDSNHRPNVENLFLSLGSTVCLQHIACSLFKKGDKLGIDSPYYFAFNYDFIKSGIVLSTRDIKVGTLMDRVNKSYETGQKGYLVVSPHNPTGQIIDSKELQQVFEWAVQHPEYQIMCDQIYRKSAHSKSYDVFTSINYAEKYENFHLIRGFSKDFGLCGFRVGFLITCNKKVKANFKRWETFIKPQAYLLNVITLMLQGSGYAQEIYDYNETCLQKATKLSLDLMKKEGVEHFLEPKGGIFMMLDFSKYLEEHPEETEDSLWIKLFYDYRVFIVRGCQFKCQKPGVFRIVYLKDQATIIEGITRMGKLLRGQKMPFSDN